MSKEITFEVPEGYVIDKEKSTDTKLVYKLKEEEVETYDDVAKELFSDKKAWYIDAQGEIVSFSVIVSCHHPNNCTTEKQAKKLLALNKMMNVAKYLNGDGKPDWSNSDNTNFKWKIGCVYGTNELTSVPCTLRHAESEFGILFKNQEACEKCIKILGKETVLLALSTDF